MQKGQKSAKQEIPEPQYKQLSNQSPKQIKKQIDIMGVSFFINQRYQLNKLIGKGAYGIVAGGIDKLTGQTVAVKKVTNIFDNLGDTKRVLREIRILKFLKHRNIISLLDIASIDDENNFSEIYMIFELMASNLATVVSRNELKDLLSGVYYMHSADIIHRDLKPENLLVSNKCQLKIGDLNLARKCQEEDDSNSIYVVTRWYRAPEVLLFSSSYTKAIDIWSIGCILAELIGRTTLFKGQDYMDQFMRIVAIMGHPNPKDFQGDSTVTQNLSALLKTISSFSRDKVKWQQLFQKANPQCLDLLDHMLVYNPKQRYTVQECLRHPYLKQQYQLYPPQKCQQVIDWSFDNLQISQQLLRQKMIQQINSFRSTLQIPTFKRQSSSQVVTTQTLQKIKKQSFTQNKP